MQEKEIQYQNLSVDYERLYNLLINGYTVIGIMSKKYFCKALYMESVTSKLCAEEISYLKETKQFKIGYDYFNDKIEVMKEFKRLNVRYFDLEHIKL